MALTLQQIREKYPDYAGLGDDQLAHYLHEHYYSDMSFKDFASTVGYEPPLLKNVLENNGLMLLIIAYALFLVKVRSSEVTNSQKQSVPFRLVGDYQKFLLLIVIAVFVLMFVYPPFQVIGKQGIVYNMGYDWIFDPPKKGNIVASVNESMLLVQWIGVLVVGGLAFLLVKKYGDNQPISFQSQKPKIENLENEKFSNSRQSERNNIESAPDSRFSDKSSANVSSTATAESMAAQTANLDSTFPEGPSQTEFPKGLRWKTVFKYAAAGAVLALFFAHSPPNLQDPVNSIAYKVVAVFTWGFFGAVVGTIAAFSKRP